MLAESRAPYGLQQALWPDRQPPLTPGYRNPISGSNKHLPVHRWVNWIAGFSGDFVGHLLDSRLADGSLSPSSVVLDPFMGVGTTLVEAQLRGLDCVGFDINPFPFLATKAKLEAAEVDQDELRTSIEQYNAALRPIETAIDGGVWDAISTPRRAVPPGFRSRIPFFSAAIERKVLATLDFIDEIAPEPIRDIFRLAFATTMVSFSNYSYEPSLATRPGSGKPLIENAPVVEVVGAKLKEMALDIRDHVRAMGEAPRRGQFNLRLGSFLEGAREMPAGSIDLVITSPPYLNNYHYVRNTRPHLFWLDFVTSSQELKQYETSNFGKFWQTVRDGERVDLAFKMPRLEGLLERLRAMNPEKGVYGGAGWANYAATYFSDSERLFRELYRAMRRGGTAVIVVGNNLLQGIEFKVDEEMAEIARLVGFSAKTEIIREQRVGSSIIGTGLREKMDERVVLYEAAVTLTR